MKKLVTFFLLLALVLCTFSTSFAAMGQAGPYDIAAGTEGYSPSKYASRYGASAAYSCSMSLAQYKINGAFATPNNEIKAHFGNRQLKKQVTSRMPLTGGLNEWQSFSYLSSSYIGASYTYKPVTYKNRTALINSRVTIATQWIP